MTDWITEEGSPFPLGATWIEKQQAWNFALYSRHAESVTLLLFSECSLTRPVFTYTLDYLRNKSDGVWHCRLARTEIDGARYYAYSISGPESQGGMEYHCFNSNKVLFDPYAKAIFFPPDFDRLAALGPGSNLGMAPVGLLAGENENFDWGDDCSPRHQSDLILYELHVRGFTNSPNSGVSPEQRGAFGGIIEKIPYLQDLGITAVELMPIFQFDPQEGNYWGYVPLSFFAPHHGYGSSQSICDQHNQFREMVKALHAAGIEVILDVVYNHTGEGNERGPIYSYKGIDNTTYYLLSGRSELPYANYSGTGNTLRCSNRHVRKMIVDSLRYWVNEMHVDGFRFDLASIFARTEDGSLNLADPPIFGDILSDPSLSGIRLIAEPWDAGGAYQLGRSFPAAQWYQWNGRFRDDLRRFVRGDFGLVPTMMQRLYGSDDLFPGDRQYAFHPYQSVNYVTSHDGFTLYDLVTYQNKQNMANGHNNSDGQNDNYSWNCGHDGDDGVTDEVLQLRRRQAKNFFCLTLLANGTPLIRAGDEFLQTQGGNNNPYNQDNPTTWIDWGRRHLNQDVFRFVRGMVHFRKNHPTLGRSRFWREDVRWYGTGAIVDMRSESQMLAYFLSGSSQRDIDLYVMINMSDNDEMFEIQEGISEEWLRIVNTALLAPDDFCDLEHAPGIQSMNYLVHRRSVVLLARTQIETTS